MSIDIAEFIHVDREGGVFFAMENGHCVDRPLKLEMVRDWIREVRDGKGK